MQIPKAPQPESTPAKGPEATIRTLVLAYQNAVALALETSYSWTEVEPLKQRLAARDKSRRISLLRLPVEVIEVIGSYTSKLRHLSRLSRTCHKFHTVLTPILYHQGSDEFARDHVWLWLMRKGRPDTIRKAIGVGVTAFTLRHLQEAAKYGNCDMISTLLCAKNIFDEWYIFQEDLRDPLATAIAHGQVKAVQLLLSHARDKGISSFSWLHAAAKQDDVSIVKTLLASGVNVSARDAHGTTALVCAVEFGRMDMCRVLLEHGADPNDTNNIDWSCLQIAASKGYTAIVDMLLCQDACMPPDNVKSPLRLAVESGSVSTINLLLQSGCNAQTVDPYGCTLLHVAARSGRSHVIETLLHSGVDIHSTDSSGETALHDAVWATHFDAVQTLAARGANLEAIDENGWTPLFRSVMRPQNLRITALLISLGADVHHVDASGKTSIHRVKDVETLRLLLENGADINTPDTEGGSAFLSICFWADVEMLKLMLEHGGNITATDNIGFTPLFHSASKNGNEAAVAFLIERGASVNPAPTASEATTPLYEAANRGHNEICKLLIEAGADVNAKNHEGWTPLHAATDECCDEVVQLLLERGADPNARSYTNGMTPLLIAASWAPHPPCERVRLLLMHGADAMAEVDGGFAIHGTFGVRYDETEAIQELVRRGGVDPNLQTGDGETALMMATARRRDILVAWLLENGADATLQDNHGKTALHQAKTVAAAEALLKHGADIHARDGEGMTPLLNAASSASAELANWLLDHGADGSSTCRKGNAALHYAVASGDPKIMSTLLQHGAHVEVKDANEQTPLFAACTKGYTDVARVLLDHGADAHMLCKRSSPFDEAICEDQSEVLRLLLEHGARVDTVPENGLMPLFHAAKHGHGTVVRLLLTYGAAGSKLNEDGGLAADVAMAHGHEMIADL